MKAQAKKNSGSVSGPGQTIPVSEDLSPLPGQARSGPPGSPSFFIKVVAALAILGATLFVGVPSASATTWNLPATDLSEAGQDANSPQVAIAPDGATTVVWDRSIIQAATRPAGSGTYGAPQNLSEAGRDAGEPRVAISPDGATTVVWERFNGTNFIIQAATRPAGSGTFGAPQNLSEAGQDAAYSALAIGPDGATTVVWTRLNGTNFIIQAATRPAGSGTFGAAQDLSEAGQDAFSHQVAIAPDGATTVVWERFNGTNSIIQAATRPAGSGTFGAPQNLSEAGRDAEIPQVAIAPDGATTVVWERFPGTNFIIQAATRPAGSGTFGAPQNLSEAGQDARFPQVAIAPDGATTVVWERFNGTNDIIQAVSRESEAPPPVTRQLSVTKSGSGEGTVTSTPAGIDCGLTCQVDFDDGASVTLTATPASGSTFTEWSGACSGTGPCEVTMREARSVTATFTADPSPPTPTSKITVSSVKSKVTKKSVLITSKVKVPGKGEISQQATSGEGQKSKVWCKTSKTVGAAGTYTLKCNLGSEGRKAIRKQALKLDLRTNFAPAEGSKVTADRNLAIKRKR